MSKKLKYILGAILSLAILGGCKEEMPSLGEGSSEETASGADTSAAAATAIPAKEEKETSAETSENSKTTVTTAERDDISEEQAALERLIAAAAMNKEGHIIRSPMPLFGDFDGDGVNELIAFYGNDLVDVWFASGDKAERIVDNGYWSEPEIVTSCGKVFIKMEYIAYATSSTSAYFLVENSSVSDYSYAVPYGQDVYPYGEFGDFTAQHGTYDMCTEFCKNAPEGSITTGHTWKSYWYYSMNGEAYEYTGRVITEEEFLKYEGAKAVLDEAAANGKKVGKIIKRGCGIINVNLVKEDETEEYIFTSYYNKALKYRGGKLFSFTEFYDNCGNYVFDEDTVPTDFERFSEMIYDAAEGDENSFIRERFYGDVDNDGKNELYAYYGTDGDFSLWFADENGAKRVSEDISLFYADGDVLMKNGDDYFVVKNGKSEKLTGAEAFYDTID